MYEQVLKQFREAAARRRVYLTIHANKELKSDRLSYADIISCLLTGEIMEQQFDGAEEKYVVYGDALSGAEIGLAAKLAYEQSAVIITVFRLRITDYDY